MGMFDYVNFKMKCPNCETELNEFQSKDGLCLMNTVEFWEVDNFYDFCRKCGTWVSFILKENRNKKYDIEDYKISIDQQKGRKDI